MTPTQRWILIAYGAIVAAWPIRHLVVTVLFRLMPRLTRDSPRYDGASPPRVTAIIPAKDEQNVIRTCLESVCAQSYPNLDILVVDDRSADGTPGIVRAIAAGDPRVRLRTIAELPPGWTGKTHALHVAQAEATGEWLWFLDADTRHEPDSLSIVMEYARRHGAAMASLLPEMRCETFWERAVQPLMGIVLMRSYPLFRVNRDGSGPGFANGQYILVRRDAYDAIGGHDAVRHRFLEDIALAKRIKAAGYPIRVAVGTEISSTRMYTSLGQIVRGWSRILYDGLDRNVPLLFGKILEPLVWSQTGTVALVAGLAMLALGTPGPFAGYLTLMAVVHLLLQVSVLWRMYRIQSPAVAGAAVWYPLAGIVSDWIILKSIAMCLTGRVTWRGTSYGPGHAPADPSRPASRGR
jgi:glycosyltransferase involved in cell wall biosynthesis